MFGTSRTPKPHKKVHSLLLHEESLKPLWEPAGGAQAPMSLLADLAGRSLLHAIFAGGGGPEIRSTSRDVWRNRAFLQEPDTQQEVTLWGTFSAPLTVLGPVSVGC